MSTYSLRSALYIGLALAFGMVAREYSRAVVASRAGDPTPRLWGRLTWNPRSWFEPFGSGLVPALIMVLWAVGSTVPPPAAYGKPAPVEPAYFRHHPRDDVLVGLAGPLANIVLATTAGLSLRLGVGVTDELFLALIRFEFTWLCLALFHLLPIPGLDGARLIALLLRPDVRGVYLGAEKYLPLFVLVALFVLATPLVSLLYLLVDAGCTVISGFSCVP
jgi:Zn-dependent protease